MKIIFMGTPDFAVPIFFALMREHEVVLACTQPDRPKGRGMALQPSPVKKAAQEAGVPVFTPVSLRTTAARDMLARQRAEVYVVAAYGLRLGPKVLALPTMGCVNVHGSLLPRYRGASPMQAALLNGDRVTGITTMYMNAGIDTGDMILQKELAVGPDENFQSLHDRMAALGAECILETLRLVSTGSAPRIPQDDNQATHTALLSKADALMDWCWPSARIVNYVRAFDPWLGAYVLRQGQPFKIWRCEKADAPAAEPPGTILKTDKLKGILVQTGDGAVWVSEVQAVGKKRMPAADFLRGAQKEELTRL